MKSEKLNSSFGYDLINSRTIAALFICVLLLSLSACKERGTPETDMATQPGLITYSDTSSSMVKVFDQNGKVCIQQSNTYYELTDVYKGKTRIPLLLKIKKVELCFADSVNRHKVYEVEAQSIPDSKSLKWKADFVATDIMFKDNTLLVIHEGVESEEDFIKRFSLTDGKEVFSCSYGDLKVAVPNVKDKRFIGYTSRRAASGPIQGMKEENLLGIVRYSSGSNSIGALKILLKRSKVAAKIPVYTPEIVLVSSGSGTTAIDDGKSIIMMKADENYTSKDIGGFNIQFTYYYGDDNETAKILIPVSDDKLDYAHAVYDMDIFEITAF